MKCLRLVLLTVLTSGCFLTGCSSASSNTAISPVAKTGQTISYCRGDDGDLQKGLAWPSPRFTDHGDGTVTDNLTGLEWAKAPHAIPGNSGKFKWTGAIDFCGSLDYAGHSDWRLPSRKETMSIIDYGQQKPSLPAKHPFTGIQTVAFCGYWSSTTYIFQDSAAWCQGMGGSIGHPGKVALRHAWPVRGGGKAISPVPKTGQHTIFHPGDDGKLQSGVVWPTPRFTDNGDGTMTDKMTGLEWAKAPHKIPGNAGGKKWKDGVEFCMDLDYAGYSDWRLPNAKEQESLVRCEKGDWGDKPSEWLNSCETPFIGILPQFYWVSTTNSVDTSFALRVSMKIGYVRGNKKSGSFFVWPVRDGRK